MNYGPTNGLRCSRRSCVKSADLVNPSGGQWPHYHIYVQTPSGLYDSAVNLKSLTQIEIEYRARTVDPLLFANVLSLPDGWTKLAQTSTSGALDYVRRNPSVDRSRVISFQKCGAAQIGSRLGNLMSG
jgi:hypothetical protein